MPGDLGDRHPTRGPVRPLIGVTTSEIRKAETVRPIPEGEPPRAEMALGLTYLKAVERAGGSPVVIPPIGEDAIVPMVERLSGLCLSGGPDLHPGAYGRDPHPALGPTWRELDRAEIALARAAFARGIPILAICRGAQTLNIARRGTLFQHLPEDYGAEIDHRIAGYGADVAHSVEIEPGSLLAEAVGTTELEVNSYHHQAADQLGRDLRAVAWSPDGVIEGIEATNRDFVVGVQWHAEAMSESPAHSRLFRSFLRAAHAYELGTPTPALAPA